MPPPFSCPAPPACASPSDAVPPAVRRSIRKAALSLSVHFRPIADISGPLHQAGVSERRELTKSERRQAGCGCGVLAVLFAVTCFYSFGNAMCETTTYVESRSPSGATDARVQMTDCGALSGYSRVVWVQPALLPRDRSASCRAVALNGQPNVRLDWSAEALIVTTNAPPSDIIASASSCYGWPVELRHGSAL